MVLLQKFRRLVKMTIIYSIREVLGSVLEKIVNAIWPPEEEGLWLEIRVDPEVLSDNMEVIRSEQESQGFEKYQGAYTSS
jgi:hypothetical protein